MLIFIKQSSYRNMDSKLLKPSVVSSVYCKNPDLFIRATTLQSYLPSIQFLHMHLFSQPNHCNHCTLCIPKVLCTFFLSDLSFPEHLPSLHLPFSSRRSSNPISSLKISDRIKSVSSLLQHTWFLPIDSLILKICVLVISV